MNTNENDDGDERGTDLSSVRAAVDESLPRVHPERYGAFETRTGETILYDSDAKGAWIRADHSVELER